LAGYKTISMGLLIVLVALAGVSPVFAQNPLPPFGLTFDPPAACPGTEVQVYVVLGQASTESLAHAANGLVTSFFVWSDPVGLIAGQDCLGGSFFDPSVPVCRFLVSESASCGTRYTVTWSVKGTTAPNAPISEDLGSGLFEVSCCAVGGCVQPVNTFGLIAPWLAVIGLVGCISTVAVVARKRRP
jgi:hypothetical protein